MQPTSFLVRLFNQVARIILFCICAGKRAILVTILNAKLKAASKRTTTIAYSIVGFWGGGGEGRGVLSIFPALLSIDLFSLYVCFVYFRSCDDTLVNCFFKIFSFKFPLIHVQTYAYVIYR